MFSGWCMRFFPSARKQCSSKKWRMMRCFTLPCVTENAMSQKCEKAKPPQDYSTVVETGERLPKLALKSSLRPRPPLQTVTYAHADVKIYMREEGLFRDGQVKSFVSMCKKLSSRHDNDKHMRYQAWVITPPIWAKANSAFPCNNGRDILHCKKHCSAK